MEISAADDLTDISKHLSSIEARLDTLIEKKGPTSTRSPDASYFALVAFTLAVFASYMAFELYINYLRDLSGLDDDNSTEERPNEKLINS